jgi:hypothetical protein
MRKIFFSLIITGLLAFTVLAGPDAGSGPSKGALIFGIAGTSAAVLSLGFAAYCINYTETVDPASGSAVGYAMTRAIGIGTGVWGVCWTGVAVFNWIKYARSLGPSDKTSLLLQPNGIALSFKF